MVSTMDIGVDKVRGCHERFDSIDEFFEHVVRPTTFQFFEWSRQVYEVNEDRSHFTCTGISLDGIDD
jgi:hypothetical protein